MDLIFNELCLVPVALDRFTAQRGMVSLQDTVQAARRVGVGRVLRTTRDFWELVLADSYTIRDWSNDGGVDRELRRWLRSAVEKAPFVESLHERAEDLTDGLAECLCEGRKGLGLGLAVLYDVPVVGLPSVQWSEDPLVVVARTLTDEGYQEQSVEVCNLHAVAVVAQRASWIEERQRRAVRSGVELLELRSSLLERLDFTDNALSQVRGCTGHERPFTSVVQHLFALNKRARGWALSGGQGAFSSGYPFPCSEESSSTLNAYGDERRFRCPDGIVRIFSWHSKIGVDAWRIHFIADAESYRVLVGYIGRHLPTPRHPT